MIAAKKNTPGICLALLNWKISCEGGIEISFFILKDGASAAIFPSF